MINPEKIKQVKQHDSQAILFRLARVPQTSRFFVGGSDFRVCEIDLAQPKLEFKSLGRHESYVTGVALALGGKVLVSGGYDGRLLWWDTDKKTQIRSVEAHKKWIRAVVVSPDGRTIASVADDMVCRLWNAADGKLLRELCGHAEKTPNHFQSMLYACAWSPDGKLLATADKVAKVVVWEAATGKQAATLEAPTMYTWDPVQRIHSIGGIRSLAFSPDGRQLAVGGTGRINNIDHLEAKARAEVFDWLKRERTHEFVAEKSQGIVNYLAFHPKGDWLMGGGGAGDGFLIFMDLKAKKLLHQQKVPMHVHDVALNETAEQLYVAGHHKLVQFELKG
jgi:WD40 repeat protein